MTLDETPPPEAVKLSTPYDGCLLGHTVSIHGQDRFVYSLKRLIAFTMQEYNCEAPEARQIILASYIKPLAEKHGEACPVWVNDEIVLGSVEETGKSVIVLPTKLNGRKR